MSLEFTVGKPLRTYSTDGTWRDWSTDELVGAKLNYHKGWKCGAGVDNLSINMDGIVYSATCHAGGILGNVWDDFTIPTEWLDCPQQTCSCGADLFIPKTQKLEHKILLRKTLDLPTEDRKDLSLTNFVATERTHASNLKQVYWEIGRRCNYDCGYCFSWIHNNTDPHKTIEELMKATRLIEEKFIKGAKVNFIISGGEPTTNKHFIEWLRYLNSCGHHISLHSNGSRKPVYYKEIIHYGDLNLSVHFEFYNKDKFLEVVSAITEEKVKNRNQGVGHLEVKFMMAPHNRAEALELCEALENIPEFKNYCTWSFVPIRGSFKNKEATSENIDTESLMSGYTDEDFKLFGN